MPLKRIIPGRYGVLIVLVLTLNRSFYPTTSAVPPVFFLILHPRDTNSVVTDSSETEKNQTSLKNQGRQIKCYCTGYESTARKRHPRNKSYEKKF